MANDTVIGSAKVRITAETAEFDAAVSRSKVEITQFSDAATATAENGLGSLGKAIEARTVGVRKLQGAVSSAVGAVTGFVSVIGSLIGALTLLGKALNERFEETMRINNAVSEASVKFNELQHSAKRALEGTTPTGLAAEYERIEEHVRELDVAFSQAGISQVKLINEVRPELAKYKQDLIDIARQTERLAEMEAARNELRQSLVKNLGDEERMEFEAAQRISDLRRQLAETESEVAKKLLDEAIAHEKRAREAARAEFAEQERQARNKAIEEDEAKWWESYTRRRNAELRLIREKHEAQMRALEEEERRRERMRFGNSNQSFVNAGITGPRTLPRQGGVFESGVR